MVDDALFDDGDEVEDGAQGEGGHGDAKQVLAAAHQGKNGMQQTERIERCGHAEPDDAHFSHGRRGELESEITVYRGGAVATGRGADEGMGARLCGLRLRSRRKAICRHGGVIEELGGGFADFSRETPVDRKSTRLNSSHLGISYAV